MRRINVKTIERVVAPATFGPAPDLRWLEIAQLVIDPAYQRELGRRNIEHIRKIASKFDWRLFSCVIVSPVAGGSFAIVDGQHRTHAAALLGIEMVPCQVIQAEAGMQAKAFAAINGSTIGVSPLARYKAALASGDVEAQRIREATEKARCRVLFSPKSQREVKPGETVAYAAVAKIVKAMGVDDAAFLFECARLMVNRNGIYLRAELLTALSGLLTFEKPSWRHNPALRLACSRLDQERLVAEARKFASEAGEPVWNCLCGMLLSTLEEELDNAP